MDIQAILEVLPHRYPFLMVDRVVAVDPGHKVVAIKNVTFNEPHFRGHFPGQPIMPGVLITEAFAQVAGLVALTGNEAYEGQAVYLLGLDRVRFRRPVVPGDQLVITAELEAMRRAVWTFRCRAEVDGRRVADGRIMATVAEAEARAP